MMMDEVGRGLAQPRAADSSIEDVSSRIWPVTGILKQFVRDGLVARALWSSAYAESGISCTE